MEDFLNQISEDFIQERTNRLKQKIEVQKKSIFNKIHQYRQQLSNMLSSKVNKKSSAQSLQNTDQIKNPSSLNKSSQSKDILSIHPSKQVNSQQVPSKFLDAKQSQNCFLLFEKACSGILNTYFPLLMDDQFLCLQSQEQINDKISYLNSVVEKTAIILIRKLTKPDQLLAQIKKDHFIQQDMGEKEQSSIEISCENQDKTKKIKKRKSSKETLQKKRGKNKKIPNESTYVMQKWLLQNFQDPYPSIEQKHKMSQESGLTVYQVNNWFINARQRVIKKFLKKDNSSIQVNSKSTKYQEEDEFNGNAKRQKKSKVRSTKSHNSQQSLKLSKSSEEKDEIEEEK